MPNSENDRVCWRLVSYSAISRIYYNRHMEYQNVLAFTTRLEFRKWLEENSSVESECYLSATRGKPDPDHIGKGYAAFLTKKGIIRLDRAQQREGAETGKTRADDRSGQSRAPSDGAEKLQARQGSCGRIESSKSLVKIPEIPPFISAYQAFKPRLLQEPPSLFLRKDAFSCNRRDEKRKNVWQLE